MNSADREFPRDYQPIDTSTDEDLLEQKKTIPRAKPPIAADAADSESSSSVEIIEGNNNGHGPLATSNGNDKQPNLPKKDTTSLVGRSIVVPQPNQRRPLREDACQSPLDLMEQETSVDGPASKNDPLTKPPPQQRLAHHSRKVTSSQKTAEASRPADQRVKRVIAFKQTGGRIRPSSGNKNHHSLSGKPAPSSSEWETTDTDTNDKEFRVMRRDSASSHSSASSFEDEKQFHDNQHQSNDWPESMRLVRNNSHQDVLDLSDDDEYDNINNSHANDDDRKMPGRPSIGTETDYDRMEHHSQASSSKSPECIDLTFDDTSDSENDHTVEENARISEPASSTVNFDAGDNEEKGMEVDNHPSRRAALKTESTARPKRDNTGHKQLEPPEIIDLLDSSDEENTAPSSNSHQRSPTSKRARAVDEAGCDSSDDEMAKILESMNGVSATRRKASSARDRRRMRNSLGTRIRKDERLLYSPGGRSQPNRSLFSSPRRRNRDSYPSSASSASEVEDLSPQYSEEDTKTRLLQNARAFRNSDTSDDIEVIDLLDDSSDEEANFAKAQDARNHVAARPTKGSTRKEETEEKFVRKGHENTTEWQSTQPVSDESEFSDKTLLNTEVESAKPPETNAFAKLVYGSSTADRIGFWQGDRLFQRQSDAIIFEDDALDESSTEVSSNAPSYVCDSDDQSSLSSSDDSSFRGSPPKRKGTTESPGFTPTYLSRFEDLVKRREAPPQIEKKFTTRDLAVTNTLLPPNMNVVEHLSNVTYNDLGQPEWTFTVYGGCDETLYRFRINIDKSTIPGAGWGAFITYLGSSHLQPKLCHINSRILKRRTLHTPKTFQNITFKRPDGQKASLKLKGTNLHGNDNNLYWPQTMLPLKSSRTVPGRRKPIIESVHLTGHNLHDDPELRALKSRDSKHDKDHRIGHLDALLSTDYVHGNAEFDLRDSSIYVGRYGPLRREDRKPESLFLCKSFIFQHLPAGYCFQVVEEMNNEVQIVDICDDQTGLNHSAALKSIPTYVNEVGHDLSNVQNVFITDHEERSIEYTFVLPDDKTLVPGERMELLTNYYSAYETDRVRNGYGLANIFRGRKGDEDMAAYMMDRLRERLDTINVLATTTLFQWTDVLEQMKEAIHDPLVTLLDNFVEGDKAVISTLQITALRRTYWLRSRFAELLDSVHNDLIDKFGRDDDDHDENVFSVRIRLIRQCRTFIAGISCPEFITGEGLHDIRCLNGSKKQSISSALEKEAVEECCFALRKRIVKPFDDSVWCSISCDLLKKLSRLTAESLWPIEECSDEEKVRAVQDKLLENYIAAGEVAALRLCEAIRKGDFELISFSSGLREGMILTGTITQHLTGKRSNARSNAFFLDHSTTPKGYISAVCQRLQYYDCIIAGLEIPLAVESFAPLDHNERYVMTQFPIEEKAFRQMGSKPTPVCRVRKCNERINEHWYLAHQIGYLVAAFGEIYCGKTNIIDCVSNQLGIDPVFCNVADRGVQPDDPSFKLYCRSKDKIKIEKVQDLPKSIFSRQRKFDKFDRTPVHPQFHYSQSSDGHKIHSDSSKTKRPLGDAKLTAKKVNSFKAKQTRQKKKEMLDPFGIRKQSPVLVYEGAPDEKIPGGWPNNWTKRVYQRQSGNSKGHTDRYYYSPAGHKLRSLIQVSRYFKCLEAFNGDESKAWESLRRAYPK